MNQSLIQVWVKQKSAQTFEWSDDWVYAFCEVRQKGAIDSGQCLYVNRRTDYVEWMRPMMSELRRQCGFVGVLKVPSTASNQTDLKSANRHFHQRMLSVILLDS